MDRRCQCPPTCVKIGVSPRGAQVRQTTGCCESPLSSSKTSQACRRLAFFLAAPSVASSTARWLSRPVRGPAGPAVGGTTPTPAGSARHAQDGAAPGEVRDHLPAARGSVHRSVLKPAAPGPARSAPATAANSFAFQLRLAAGPPRPFEPGPALRLPRVVPVVCALPRHAKGLGHGRLRRATREQPRRLQPARFQRGNIPVRKRWKIHASTCDRTGEIR